jgi:hypothetical protein
MHRLSRHYPRNAPPARVGDGLGTVAFDLDDLDVTVVVLFLQRVAVGLERLGEFAGDGLVASVARM